MDKVHINYSLKNIPIPNEFEYKKVLIQKTENFIKRLRWKTYFFETPEARGKGKKTYGFKTQAVPHRQLPLLTHFENDLLDIIKNVKFRKYNNQIQEKMKQDLKEINCQTNHIMVKADKTRNIYKLNKDKYNKLLQENITNEYKKENNTQVHQVNLEAKNIACKLEIADRMEIISEKQAYITLKDHKENFTTRPKCRLINPAKTEMGKISKRILQWSNYEIKRKLK